MEQGDGLKSVPRERRGGPDAFASLQIVCAWCQQPLRWHRVQPPLPLQTSYGICPACLVQVLRELRVWTPATPQTVSAPDAACRAGQGGARRSAPVAADTPPSSVQADPLPASGGACVERVRDTRLHAQVLRAVATDARQRAKKVQEEACHSRTLACAVGLVHRYLSTHARLPDVAASAPKQCGRATHRGAAMLQTHVPVGQRACMGAP